MKYLLLLFILYAFESEANERQTIKFKSKDGLEMAGDLYMKHPTTAPFIILFHQANWSRGEYQEIAPKLNALGYNCLAIDLRSGGNINDVQNITRQNALKAMKVTQYVDALPDMIAAIEYSRTNFAEGKLIIWGSSYSAALSLKLAGDMVDKISAVIAFSPGEYFASQGQPRDFITASAININQPAFITSARDEKNNWWGIYVAIPSDNKSYFLPESSGNHGSKALWAVYPDSIDYWEAVSAFIESI